MKYRKKPIIIEAEQFFPEVHPWPKGVVPDRVTSDVGCEILTASWMIKTLAGPHSVSIGDWIITGIAGEKYPCKPDIFEQTYELVGE